MTKNVIIIGAGGHAKVVTDIILENNDNVLGYLDDKEEKQNTIFYKDIKVIDKVSNANKYTGCYFIIAIGNNRLRAKIAEIYRNLKWYTAIHPHAILSNTAKIGMGTTVMAGVVVNADAKIGQHCIINTSCSVDHDSRIDDYVHISPGARVAGGVFIGARSWICTGSTVINNIHIHNDTIIGAGATVINDINQPGVYIGTPARVKQ